MCGIAGFVGPLKNINSSAVLRSMSATITHRGPDDDGFFEATTRDSRYQIGLAHRRLSIIDLSTGHQPMGNEDDNVQIIFNGEIYNFHALRDELIALGHHFVTASDTETIVHAYEQWGERCVEYFRGMFAFVIWDSRNERLFLARDRFGKKPLFLCEVNGVLAFASEIKSILAFPGINAEVDTTSVWDYLAYRYVPAPATLFRGIRKLMPGCYAVWERGILTERCYYQPPDREISVDTPLPDDPIGVFLDKLDEAVKIRMIADVPFGAFLSGGIDSSAVVGLMSRHSVQPIKTFSVGFSEAGYSELGYAKTIAEQFKTDHHELVVSQEHLMQHLPALVRFRDAPVAEPSDIPIYLLAKEARRTVKMVLTGEGADEFLGGYPKHVYERYASLYQAIPGFVRHGILEPLVQTLPYRFRRTKTAIVNLGLEQFEERMPRWFGALSDTERRDLVALSQPISCKAGVQFDSSPENSALRRILYFDQSSWLPDNLLERGDRMTMAASLEARMPFMDHELAAFISNLPDKYRVRGHTTKWILREAMKRLLPTAILQRPKVGFRVPVNEWFQGPMRDYLYEHLTGSTSFTREYYQPVMLEKVLADHVAGRQNHEKLLWSMLNLEIWHRQYLK
ncbi:asparagine synthase (glutamine-hydrolyzing) [Nitrosomonas sp.]|uniref:asparagine synthase (glutamine-hydrolyzing) n=1 Tax=Nitrosomonas sp. TaxID=42353 RepID=UPI0025E8CAC3|nr:asparagine synthase (glutamine-hydrolyzing) [Nitrosomonas sp.]